MTVVDPYAVLLVHNDATPEEIKRSYRLLAQRMHPDKGGDGSRFLTIQAAYELLSDPERRAWYDERGEDKPIDTTDAEAREVLVEMFIKSADGQAWTPRRYVEAIRAELNRVIAAARNAIAQVEIERSKLASLLPTGPDAENIFAGALTERHRTLDSMVKEATHNAGVARRALDLIAEYRDNVPPAPVYRTTGTATTGSY